MKLTTELEKELRADLVGDYIASLLFAEIDRLRNAECICPSCATEWSLEQPTRLHDEYRKKLLIAIEALEKIADPRKRDHKEPDTYTQLGCVMNMADEALSKIGGNE